MQPMSKESGRWTSHKGLMGWCWVILEAEVRVTTKFQRKRYSKVNIKYVWVTKDESVFCAYQRHYSTYSYSKTSKMLGVSKHDGIWSIHHAKLEVHIGEQYSANTDDVYYRTSFPPHLGPTTYGYFRMTSTYKHNTYEGSNISASISCQDSGLSSSSTKLVWSRHIHRWIGV